MTTKILTVQQEGVTLDLLLFREFQNEVQLRVESVLTANAYLAERGIFLPVGTNVEIEIPDTVAGDTPVVRVRRLWG